jgi:type I site-specific restriction-modification system R (restriction) subunit
LFFGDLLHAQVRAFNPKYKEAEGALVGEFQRFHSDIYGNRDFLTALRNQHKFFSAEENRELDVTLIDYGDLGQQPEKWRNIYEVTEEFYFHNGRYGTRDDVVFLINGIPVLVIECKNATKEEGIALGVDQIRRDEVNAIVKDIGLLKQLLKAKMDSKAPAYLALVTQNFNDKDVDNLIEHFRVKERRKEFFKEYKEIEMLYEIVSPDAFLRPYLDDYATLSSIYAVVRKAYAKTVYIDKAFQRKTNELVQGHIDTAVMEQGDRFVKLDHAAIDTIKKSQEGRAVKIINLVKSIERAALENSDDPFLVALAERARAVQESFEERQSNTEEALAELLKQIERDEDRKKVQAIKGLDGLTYFVLCKLTDEGVANAEIASKKVRDAFAEFSNWRQSEKELRELRQKVTFAIFAGEDDLDKVTALVDSIFSVLQKAAGA